MNKSVHPVKLAYRGVLIERPCDWCDTVDIHFEDRCNSGPCAAITGFDIDHDVVCGLSRYFPNRGNDFGHGVREHDQAVDHKWVAHTYYPADIEFAIPKGPGLVISDAAIAQLAFHKILDRAREDGQPEHYTSDLFRDYQRLSGHGAFGQKWQRPEWHQFVWKLRAHGHGTDLYFPGEMIYTSDTRGDRYFLYDGRTHGPLGDFPECNLDTARTVLTTWYGLAKIEKHSRTGAL